MLLYNIHSFIYFYLLYTFLSINLCTENSRIVCRLTINNQQLVPIFLSQPLQQTALQALGENNCLIFRGGGGGAKEKVRKCRAYKGGRSEGSRPGKFLENRVFIKNMCFFPYFVIFLNFVSFLAALVFYLSGVCTHTDTRGNRERPESGIF